MTVTLTAFLTIALVGAPGVLQATSVYMCRDDAGKVTFQQHACGSAQTEEFRGDYSDTVNRVGTFVNQNNARLLRDAQQRSRRLERAKERAGYGIPQTRGDSRYLPGTGVQPQRHDPEGRRLRMDRRQQREHERDLADRARPIYVVPYGGSRR